MERWEYQVVHLNVEGAQTAPPPGPARQGPAAAPPPRPEAVFSKEYLEKEFPGFYSSQPAGGGAQAKEHPANQLRTFLNLQGREGWQLLGFFPVGQLTMIIFRRPQRTAPSAAGAPEPGAGSSAAPEASAASPVSAAPSPPAGAASAPVPTSVAPQPAESGALLERILERLEALERRLPPPASQAPAAVTADLGGLAGLQDGEILPPQRWSELDGQPRLSTPAAARALGFRSAASLLNLAARNGYRQGLVKRGVHPALAVYVGSEKGGSGGRDRRLWVVLQDPGR